LKITIHDYGGYTFTRQIAGKLARRKHSILYIYSDTTQLIRRGIKNKEIANLQEIDIKLAGVFKKYSLLQRRAKEIEHGKKVAKEIYKFRPEVMISADTPLDAQKYILKASKQTGAKFIFWLQDAIGMATRKILEQKIQIAGGLIGRYYERLEKRMMKQSDGVMVISEDFLPLMEEWHIPDERVYLMPNWAVLEELEVVSKRNAWSERMGLADQFCFLYSGILGFKHNPELFIQLAKEFKETKDVRVVVIAEGEAAEWLRKAKETEELRNLMLLPYQPAELFAQVMGTGDVLMAILKPEAGAYSMPSKVLSYLCAQRALLLAIPKENLAARIVTDNEAGLVCEPEETGKWLDKARKLYKDKKMREKMGENARKYAEEHFNIERITDQFEEIIADCCK
jgi:colanic acid biosynthesis glycosyl transferase WcaI